MQRAPPKRGAEFLQNAAINVARQYTATEIKRVADSFFTVDPVTGERKSNVLSELVRGALHAMASCGGAAATGASCKTAAGAAVATVALNNLLIGVNTKDMTEAQKLAYSNLIQTIITGAATGMNMDSAAGQLASKMEIENNGTYTVNGKSYNELQWDAYIKKQQLQFKKDADVYIKSNKVSDEDVNKAAKRI